MPATNDILMLIVQSGSSGIPAESQAVLSSRDSLLTGPPCFEKNNFFELDTFTLNISAEPSDSAEEKKNQGVIVNAGPGKTSTSMNYKAGRGVKWNPGMVRSISCTRQIDHSSPLLFEECGNATPFPFAAIVRRKVVGGGLGNKETDHFLMSYFRLDFTGVVLTELAWNSDADGVTETFQFVCKTAKVQYRQQMHTGSLSDKKFPPGNWPK